MLVLTIGLAVLLLDQFTKLWIRDALYYGESIPVIDGFFNIVYVRNPGAAWGVLGGQNILLILISAFALVVLILYRRQIIENRLSHRVMAGLMVGGIIGNMIDRIRFAWVTDFLDFQFGNYHYPSFNVADSAICISVGLYIIFSLLDQRKAHAQEKGDA